MEAALRNVLVQSAVVGSRVYTSIPLNATFPLILYEIVNSDFVQTRPASGSAAGTVTAHGAIATMASYMVKLSIIGEDKSSVRTIKDSLLPYINGFNGTSLGDTIAIFTDDYRVESRATDANYEVGAFDLTVYHI